MVLSNSFWILFNAPLHAVLLPKCSLEIVLVLDTKLIRPLKTPVSISSVFMSPEHKLKHCSKFNA